MPRRTSTHHYPSSSRNESGGFTGKNGGRCRSFLHFRPRQACADGGNGLGRRIGDARLLQGRCSGFWGKEGRLRGDYGGLQRGDRFLCRHRSCRGHRCRGPTAQSFDLLCAVSARGNSNEGVIGTVATGFEEGTQLNGRFLGENAGNDLDLVIEARIAQNVAQ